MPTSKEQLLEIIQNGRQFLSALEQFAATNFPNDDDDDNETTTLLNKIFQDSESGRFEEAERFTDDIDGHNGKGPAPSTTAAKKRAASIDAANEASNLEYPAEATATDTNTQEDDVSRNLTDELVRNPSPEQPTKSLRRPITGAIAHYCATTGKVLAQYQSLTEAVESVSKTLPGTKVSTCKTAMTGVISGRRKSPIHTYKGYYFREIGDTTTPMPTFPIHKQSKYSHATEATQTDSTINTEDAGQKRKREDHNSGKPAGHRAKRGRFVPVLQYCAKTGKYLERFETVVAAARSLATSIPGTKEGNSATAICQILKGNQKLPVYRGFYFRSANDTMTPFPDFPIPETHMEWRETALGRRQQEERLRKAQEAIGIVAAESDPTSAAGGARQRQVREEQKTMRPRAPNIMRNRHRGIAVLQYCAKTGEQLGRFETAVAAARCLSASTPGTSEGNFCTAICSILKGTQKRPVYRGFYFRRANDTGPFPEFPIPETQVGWWSTAMGRRQIEEQERRAEEAIRTAAASQTDPTVAAEDAQQRQRHEEQNVVEPRASRVKYRKGLPVLQFCADTGKQLGHFDSAKAASESLASSTPGTSEAQFARAISQILKGHQRRPIYRGFYFRCIKDTSPYPEFPIP